MIPCIEYTRASTSHQEYSVGDQDKQIREWARHNGYKIIRSYCDDGISGHYVAKRPGFLQMIEDITTGNVDARALLIWDSYRFARNMVEFLTYKQMIQQHGLSVIAVSEPIVQDEDAQLYIDAINGASGEIYLRKLSKDSKRGIRARVADRHEHHGPAPFGYRDDKNTKEIYIDEKQAEWVRYIFNQVEDSVPYLQICHALNDSGIRTARGSEWSVYSLKYLLHNRTYCGQLEATLDGEHGIFQGKHESIIPPEQFDRVQAIMQEREGRRKKYAHSTNQYVHWLSGLMYCPVCGAAMSHVKRPGGRKPAYRCNSIGGGRRCPNGSMRIFLIEDAVFDELQKITDDPMYYNHVNVTSVKPAVDYDAKIKSLEKKLDRAKQAYLAEIDSLEEYRENKMKLTSAIENAEKQKNSPKEKISPEEFRTQARDVLETLRSDAPMDEKVSVSHALIEKVCPDSRTGTITIYFYG